MATAADAGELSAYVVSPSQDQSDAIVQLLDQGRPLLLRFSFWYCMVCLYLVVVTERPSALAYYASPLSTHVRPIAIDVTII